MKKKLEDVVESLKTVKEENLKKIEEIKSKNEIIEENIVKAENFKNNINKMLG